MDNIELNFNGILKSCTKQNDTNGELLFVSEDGDFVKFPADGDLEALVAAYNSANEENFEVVADVTYGAVIINK